MSASNTALFRWKWGEPREGRTFESADGFNEAPCFLCGAVLGDGSPVQLLAIGASNMPGDDEENRQKAGEGRWHNTLGLLLHERCLKGED